jgi:hypothetical protein
VSSGYVGYGRASELFHLICDAAHPPLKRVNRPIALKRQFWLRCRLCPDDCLATTMRSQSRPGFPGLRQAGSLPGLPAPAQASAGRVLSRRREL